MSANSATNRGRHGEAGRRGDEIRSDLWVAVELRPGGGVQSELDSRVEPYFGQAIRDQVGAVLAALGVERIFVLGDPAYYRRFGFEPERRIAPPYELPEAWADAWRSTAIGSGPPLAPGALRVPPPWADPALWR